MNVSKQMPFKKLKTIEPLTVSVTSDRKEKLKRIAAHRGTTMTAIVERLIDTLEEPKR